MKRIKRLRIERDWSQAELARRAGLNQNTVHMAENGRLIPYPGQVAKIASALGLTEADYEGLFEEVSDNG